MTQVHETALRHTRWLWMVLVLVATTFLSCSLAAAGGLAAYAYDSSPRGARSVVAQLQDTASGQHIRQHRTSSQLSMRGYDDASQLAGASARPGGYRLAPNTARPVETLFHYTDEAGQAGIRASGELRPSLRSVNPRDVRYGEGQYLSDIVPGTRTCAQLSRCFLGQPFQGNRFTHYVEIDVRGLNVVKGRDGVFVVPGQTPLDLTDRLVSWGVNGL